MRRVAEEVRAACLAAAREAWEEAGVLGLCAEGRWEAALGALRSLDLSPVVDPRPSTASAERADDD